MEERIEAADCFWMVCLGAATAEVTLRGDLAVYPVIKNMIGMLTMCATWLYWPWVYVHIGHTGLYMNEQNYIPVSSPSILL